jgi:hypothetical protein
MVFSRESMLRNKILVDSLRSQALLDSPKSLDADWLGKASRFARLRCRTLKFVFFEHLCLPVRVSKRGGAESDACRKTGSAQAARAAGGQRRIQDSSQQVRTRTTRGLARSEIDPLSEIYSLPKTLATNRTNRHEYVPRS